ncbi:helix-turn-helix domain-containing protein [Alloactinosynnema sp. L-07]|uniref:helix-turn-helix domain-containing protein n=1 Tax=Alloactinosynnema sp. L-07 TaxID=1653480 RepID=UPI0006B42AEB|nr:helix-turn-helix transcriptional regulator [Alloactinosynnema sp. L-07]
MDEIGYRLREIRHARRKSLEVVAGLAGISPSYLSRLESGKRALDRRSLIVALATALDVAPTEITTVALAAPGDVEEERSLGPVRTALQAASYGEAMGQVRPLDELRDRVASVLDDQQSCEFALVGAALPGLINDLYTTLVTGTGDQAILRLLVLTQVQGTQGWLGDIGASLDLAWQASILAKRASDRLDEPLYRAVSGFGTAFGLIGAGGFDLAERVLADADPGRGGPAEMQAGGMLALAGSLVAAAKGEDVDARLDYAADLALHVGDGNEFWFGFGPSNVGVWRMAVALESGRHEDAIHIAEQLDPAALRSPTRRSAYWRDYGRALAKIPSRRADAVMMLRAAERISPARIHRHPFTRAAIGELLAHARDDAIGREIRAMAYRAGVRR